jgi:hypothetical protein
VRPRSALRLGAWLGLVLGATLAGACFDAPRPAVQFSCDPVEAPQCPAGYSCEADGCCHRHGSDYEAHAGACKLGGVGGSGGGGSGTETAASTTGETSTTGGPASSDSTASSGTAESSGSETASTSDSGGSGTSTGTSGGSGT